MPVTYLIAMVSVLKKGGVKTEALEIKIPPGQLHNYMEQLKEEVYAAYAAQGKEHTTAFAVNEVS